MDYAKVAKLTSDAGFEASEIKAAVAALENVLINAAKYNCDDVVLENELQQLGLPREHTVSLCRPYKEQKESLRESLAARTLKLPGLESVKWRVEATLGSSVCKDLRLTSSRHQQSGSFFRGVRGEASHLAPRILSFAGARSYLTHLIGKLSNLLTVRSSPTLRARCFSLLVLHIQSASAIPPTLA